MFDNRYKGNILRRCYVTRSFEHTYGQTFVRPARNKIRLPWPFWDLSMHYYMFRNEQQFLQPLGNGSWRSIGVSWSWRRVATLGRPLLKWSFRLLVVSIRRLRRDKVDCETWNHSGTEIWSSPLKKTLLLHPSAVRLSEAL
jgi:hypothetical protein